MLGRVDCVVVRVALVFVRVDCVYVCVDCVSVLVCAWQSEKPIWSQIDIVILQPTDFLGQSGLISRTE
jgi:hypothetical protein